MTSQISKVRSHRGALCAAAAALLGVSLLASTAGAAVNFERLFPFRNVAFQSGSFRAVASCFLRTDNPALGFELGIDYQGGTAGAVAQAFSFAGTSMAVVGDVDIGSSRCKTTQGVPCRINFQSSSNPFFVRITIV